MVLEAGQIPLSGSSSCGGIPGAVPGNIAHKAVTRAALPSANAIESKTGNCLVTSSQDIPDANPTASDGAVLLNVRRSCSAFGCRPDIGRQIPVAPQESAKPNLPKT